MITMMIAIIMMNFSSHFHSLCHVDFFVVPLHKYSHQAIIIIQVFMSRSMMLTMTVRVYNSSIITLEFSWCGFHHFSHHSHLLLSHLIVVKNVELKNTSETQKEF